MDAIKPNPILEFNENHLLNVRKALGYGDINKLNQDIEHLRDWIQKENHFKVKEFDRDFLERLLIYNKGSVERTKQKFDRFCTCTNLMPEFLQNFDVKNEFHSLYNISYTCLLPKPTADNYRIIVTTLTGIEDDGYRAIQYYRNLIVIGHYVLSHDYCNGYEYIADCKNITMGTIKRINPIVVSKAMTLIVEAMGQRMKKMHFLSGSKFFDAFMTILKQGISSKLKERLIIHSNFDSLHEHVPKELLPSDLGGDGKSMHDLTESMYKEISSDEHTARIKFMETIGTDESGRLPGKFNEEYSGMPGSFKTLCVD